MCDCCFTRLTIKFDSYHNAHHNLVRVLDVTKGGPADIAGLTPETDYILGTSDKVFKNPDVMNDEVCVSCQLHNKKRFSVSVL